MYLVRDDLDDEDLAALERQFPGLTSRVHATRAASGQFMGGAEHGVQQLHPAPGPVDNPADEVRWLHPAGATGRNHRTNGVQLLPERGAAVAPEPSFEPPTEPPATREPPTVPTGGRLAAGGVSEFFAQLGPAWPLTGGQRRRLAPAVAIALSAGWAPATLAQFVGGNTAGVRSPAAVLAIRLSLAELPAPGGAVVRPPWCGACDERTRMLGQYDGNTPSRCPRCHPLATGTGLMQRRSCTGAEYQAPIRKVI